MKDKINEFKNKRRKNPIQNVGQIKKLTKKLSQALNLPKVMNLNPRSAMNKIVELETFIKEEEIDLAFISESHDRENSV